MLPSTSIVRFMVLSRFAPTMSPFFQIALIELFSGSAESESVELLVAIGVIVVVTGAVFASSAPMGAPQLGHCLTSPTSTLPHSLQKEILQPQCTHCFVVDEIICPHSGHLISDITPPLIICKFQIKLIKIFSESSAFKAWLINYLLFVIQPFLKALDCNYQSVMCFIQHYA